MYSLISIKYTSNKDNISNINMDNINHENNKQDIYINKASVYRYCDLLIKLKLINVNL